MLNRRLIPKLQLKARRFGAVERMILVTTVGFEHVLEVGDPVSQAKIYEAQAADELMFIDLDATHHQRATMVDVVRKAAEQIFMPITVGGGVCSLQDFRTLLSNGADKVAVNSAAVNDPSLLQQASEAFGAQCVVLSIDYRRENDGSYRVWTNGGRVNTGLDPVAWAIEGQKRGAGEILLTSIERDGSGAGLDEQLTRRVVDEVSIPVITSGGCGLAKHFVDGFKEAGANAVAAGTYFCFKDQNPMQTRAQIRNAGIPIRLHR
jgi:cyclase